MPGKERVTLFSFSTEVPTFGAFLSKLYGSTPETHSQVGAGGGGGWGGVLVLLRNTRIKTPRLLL